MPAESVSPAGAGTTQRIANRLLSVEFCDLSAPEFLQAAPYKRRSAPLRSDAQRQKLPLDVQQFPSAIDFGLPFNRHEPKNQKCLSNRYDRTEEWIV
jgi:hypothetical protein